MSKPRKPRHMNPELARQRRMATYPREMFEILQAASQGKNYIKQFEAHNAAGAFLSRYHKFRIDAIECRVAGALYLNDLRASGKDAEGELFNTRYKGTGPYTVTWYYEGPPPGEPEHMFSAETRTEQHEAAIKAKITGSSLGTMEDAVERWLKPEESPTAQAKRCPPHEWDATDTRCLHCGVPKPEEAQ